MLPRELAHAADDLAVESLGAGDRLPFAPQEGKVFRQRDELGALFDGADHRVPSGLEVCRQIVGRGHLHQSDAHGFNLP